MKQTIYDLMLCDNIVAKIDTQNGEINVFYANLMPLDLPIKEPATLQDKVYNITSFQDWCASRVLMMGQKHAKLICNALAISQENSSANKAKLALAYHCSNLMDAYWIKEEGSPLQYKDVSLFSNTSRNILTPVSLKGQMESVLTKKLKNWSDIGADGTLAKSWVREQKGEYYLYKQGDNINGEILASTVATMLNASIVAYEEVVEDNISYSKCKCFTTEDISFIPYHTYALYNKEASLTNIKQWFSQEYANMAVLTYLLGNSDLHDKNWGLLRDNHTGEFLGLAPYFDLNGCFLYYASSKDLLFLPEAEFVLEDGTKANVLTDSLALDMDYEVSGPTIEESAFKYCPDCTLDLSAIDTAIIPSEYRDEFVQRIDLIRERISQYTIEKAETDLQIE